jgi:hypothetical protein
MLRDLNYSQMQGFLFSKAGAGSEIEAMLVDEVVVVASYL